MQEGTRVKHTEKIKMSLKGIQHTYYSATGEETKAIEDISIDVKEGEFLAIVGASGCGKSTLLNIMCGMFAPTKGEVLIDGESIEKSDHKIGYISQTDTLLPWRTIESNVALGLEIEGIKKEERIKRARELMKTSGLKGFEKKYPFELSGGQQQRVALASVLVLEPDILVIDEPTSQLDPQETERVFEIIKTMKQMGKTIILVEHKMELVAEYCDEVVVLHQGKVIRHGDKHDVLSEIELEKFGVMLPLTVYLANELKKHGVRMKDNIITSDEMADQLQKIGKKE